MRRPVLRFDELRLARLVALSAVIGFWALTIARVDESELDWTELRPGLAFAVLVLLIAIALSLTGFSGDQLLLPLVAALSVFGYLALLRLDAGRGALDDSSTDFADRQLAYLTAGLVLMVAIARFWRHWHLVRRFRYTLLFICIGMLLATFFFGTPIYGAKLWISVGPIQVQPSEIIKIGLVLFLAAYLDEQRRLIDSPWRVGFLRLPPIPHLLPMVLMWGTSLVVLVVENDLGSALLLFGIFLVMLYLATNRALYVVVGLATFAAACWVALGAFDRVRVRVDNWFDPWRDPLDSGFQQIQSDYSLASGGVLGAGIGNGEPWRIPAVHTDYVFSAIGEELGFLGTAAILMLIAVLVGRGLVIGLGAPDRYLRLVAVGLSASIGIQTAVILGGVLRLIPLTGITLPFVSYGGSSMISNFIALGLLANISASSAQSNRRTGGRP